MPKEKSSRFKRLKSNLFILLIVNVIVLVFSIKNLVGEYYLGYRLNLILTFTILVISILYFNLTRYRKYTLMISSVIFILSMYVTLKVNKIIRNYYDDLYGVNVHISIFKNKVIKGKSGTEGYFILENGSKVNLSLPTKAVKNLKIKDTVIFIESIKFRDQYDVLNYFPTSSEIKEALTKKYYINGEYVDSLPDILE